MGKVRIFKRDTYIGRLEERISLFAIVPEHNGKEDHSKKLWQRLYVRAENSKSFMQ